MENRQEQRFRRSRRGSLFFPILLIAIGIVVLLSNLELFTGDAWDLLLKLWPVLLIVIGLDNIWQERQLSGSTFWIGLGVIFLLNNFGLLAWSIWDLFLRLWPILLIAVGLDLAIGRRSIWGALLGAVLVAGLLVGALSLVNVGAPPTIKELSWIPEVSIQKVEAQLEPAIGSLQVASLVDNVALAKGTLRLQKGESLQEVYNVDQGIGQMSVSTRGLTMVYPGGAGTSLGWDVKFSPRYPLDLQANMGVGEIRLDLRELQISSFKVNLGVGSTTVFLPAYGRYEASIEGAIGQIEVVVPEGLAVRISSDTGLTNVRVPGDFIRAEDVYTSPGYDTAQNRLELVLSQAIGRIVVRYAK